MRHLLTLAACLLGLAAICGTAVYAYQLALNANLDDWAGAIALATAFGVSFALVLLIERVDAWRGLDSE